MSFKKTFTAVTTIGIVTLLTACEPNDADINKALQVEINKANQGAVQMVGEKMAVQMQVELISTKKIACKESQGQAGYVCDVEVVADLPLVGKQTNTAPMHFVKGDHGWVAVDH